VDDNVYGLVVAMDDFMGLGDASFIRFGEKPSSMASEGSSSAAMAQELLIDAPSCSMKVE
jgi:hypothetical protein